MASTVKPLLQKISQRHLECQICKDRFKEPKMLKCSHSYCLGCLRQLAHQEQSQGNQKITCPVCRGQTSLTKKGVANLRTDFKLISLLDEIKQHETELQSQQEIQPGQESVSKCSEHTDKNLILFCYSCDKLICIKCIRKAHGMHDLAEPSEILENLKLKSNEILAAVEKHQINFNTANQNIVGFQKNLDDKFANDIKKISKKADEEVKRIRDEEIKLKMESKKIIQDNTKKMAFAKATNSYEMTTSQNKKNEFTRLLNRGSSCENLFLLRKLLKDLINYTEIKPSEQ